MGCCTSFARCLLLMFNLIFWLSGVAILSVGVWILVDKGLEEYLDVVKDAMGDEDTLRTAAYILIGFGAFVFLVGFCGCCGAIRRSKCLLGFYIFFLVIVCAGELAAGIYVAIFKGDAEAKLNTGLTDSIKNRYGDGSLTVAWDALQNELSCCGGLGPDDYDGSVWANSTAAQGNKLPDSCCTTPDDPAKLAACQAKTSDFHSEGCKAKVLQWVDDKAIILIGVGCGIAALELIGLVCAICFCRHMDRDKYEQN